VALRPGWGGEGVGAARKGHGPESIAAPDRAPPDFLRAGEFSFALTGRVPCLVRADYIRPPRTGTVPFAVGLLEANSSNV